MPSPSDLLDIRQQDNVHIVTFARDIFQPELLEDVQLQLRQLIEKTQQPRLVMDFSKLRHAGSNFLGMILEATLKTTRKQGQVRVCQMTPGVKDMFLLTRLDQIVPMHDTLESAMASF